MPDNGADKQSDLVILGGGLAGMTASMFTGAPVYEAADHAGGVAASDEVAGFTFDRGIHVLQTTNNDVLKLLGELGVNFTICERSAHIFAFGKYTAYPFQVNSTNLPIGRRLNCVWHYLRRETNPAPTNYQEWIYRTIGRGFGDTFLIPYSEKFWNVHPREMTFEWTGNRVPATNVRQVLRGAFISRNTRVGTNATFRYPAGKDGYGTVAHAIRQRIGANLHTDYRATKIDTRLRRIYFANNRSVYYSVLLSTIPLPELVKIATDVPPEVSAHAAALRTNSIMVVNLGVARYDLSAKHWIHFPEKDVVFFRISFPHNFTEGLAPPGTSAISAEVSYPPGSPPDPEALTQRVIDDLVKVRLLRANDRIIARHTRDIPYGYCIYDEARAKALAVIKGWLPTANIVAGGRYGLWTYFWSDEAILSGKKSAELAKRRLAELVGSEGPRAGQTPLLSRISHDPDAAD